MELSEEVKNKAKSFVAGFASEEQIPIRNNALYFTYISAYQQALKDIADSRRKVTEMFPEVKDNAYTLQPRCKCAGQKCTCGTYF